jgi:chondroitin AC lyase
MIRSVFSPHLKCKPPAIAVIMAALIAFAFTGYAANDEHYPQDAIAEMEQVLGEFLDELIANPPADQRVENLVRGLHADGTWPGIDYDDVSRTGFQHRQHLLNLRDLARAFRHPDSRFHGDGELRETILRAFDFWIENDFIADNWWHNEMGTPDLLSDALLLMDAELTGHRREEGARIAGRANLQGFGARPGGDLIQIAGIMGKRALFERDVEGFEEAVEAMIGEVRITTGRGMQPDLSLQHRTDRVTSTLTYGSGYAASFVRYAGKLQGTRFAFPEETLRLLVDFYLDGYHQSMAHGRYPDPPQLNRGITRRSALRARSPATPEALAAVTDYRHEELTHLAAVRRGEQEPAFSFNKFFWSSEYLSHQRPQYFASVRMFSSRNHSVEVPYNEEGLLNHHLADGANFILRTGEEYRDIFPAFDWQKIPGATVVQKPSLPSPNAIQQRGLTDFVGGVTDGLYGVAAFDFRSPLDPLAARKAWFFFDDEFVALGAGITSDSGRPVVTTLNQSLLKGPVAVPGESSPRLPDQGEHSVAGTTWVWHDDIAYLFPSSAEVRTTNRSASGTWRHINRQSWATDEEIVHDVFTLWIDHGTNPSSADYAYIVVPGIELDNVTEYEDRSPISILANTPEIQAVTHQDLQLTQIVFYEPGELETTSGVPIAVDKPSLVMLRTSGDHITQISVADPTRNHATLNLHTTARIEGSGDQWTARWDPERERSEIRIHLPEKEYAGQSITIRPTRSPPHSPIRRPSPP